MVDRKRLMFLKYWQDQIAGLWMKNDTSTREFLLTGKISFWCKNWYAVFFGYCFKMVIYLFIYSKSNFPFLRWRYVFFCLFSQVRTKTVAQCVEFYYTYKKQAKVGRNGTFTYGPSDPEESLPAVKAISAYCF